MATHYIATRLYLLDAKILIRLIKVDKITEMTDGYRLSGRSTLSGQQGVMDITNVQFPETIATNECLLRADSRN